jgi:CO dehydrogenase/acetyl-CoA synthase delta subunit
MTPPTIKAIRAMNDRLIFELDGDREVSLPLSSSSRLANATPAERDHWTIGPRGISVHWPDIDEDIAIWEVLGIAEDAYLRSLREAPVG